MTPLTTYALVLDAAQAHGIIAAGASFEDVEAMLEALGPGDENAPAEYGEDCPCCGEYVDESADHCPGCGAEFETEYSHPPTAEDRKARESFGDPS